MTRVVVVDAGRSAVVPDDAGQPETPVALAEHVIEELVHRSSLRHSELTHLFLADPRCVSTGCPADRAGWTFDAAPLGLTTTVSMVSSRSIAQAVHAIERDPDLVAAVAGTDFGAAASSSAESLAERDRRRQAARAVVARWRIDPGEVVEWAQASYRRAAESAAAGDFADEIVSALDGRHRVDSLHAPQLGEGRIGEVPSGELWTAAAHPARGASAAILTSEAKALRMGLRFRAYLQLTETAHPDTAYGMAPLGAGTVRELFAPCRLNIARLDQVEVPERYAVTPVAWLKETGMNKYLVNPRGGDLGFGHLPRSGHLRALVTMLHSLEATGGRAGAVVASGATRSTAFVLSFRSPHARTFPLKASPVRMTTKEASA